MSGAMQTVAVSGLLKIPFKEYISPSTWGMMELRNILPWHLILLGS
jgi:hypothetical protein